jgi:hypothetical protein
MCAFEQSFGERTLERMDLLTHTACGLCPGMHAHTHTHTHTRIYIYIYICIYMYIYIYIYISTHTQTHTGCGLEIVEVGKVANKKKQVARAEPGDTVPAKHCATHFGHLYGQALLMRLKRWITCKLHCKLRLTSGVLKHLIVSKITTPGQRDAVWDLWAKGGVAVRKAFLEKQDKNAAKNQFKRFSISGNDEEVLVGLLEASLEIIYPRAARALDKILRDNHANALAVVRAFTAVRASLSPRSTAFDTDRPRWAQNVRVLAQDFVRLWRTVVGNTKGVYLHVLTNHIPDMIADVGDLTPYAMQGLEHGHKKRKRGQFEYTNCKPADRGNSHMKAACVQDKLKKNQEPQEYLHGVKRREQASKKHRTKVDATRQPATVQE